MKLQPGEKVIKLYRQTKLTLVWYFILSIIALYLPLHFLNRYGLLDNLGKLPGLWIFLVVVYFLIQILLWRLNLTLMTSQRLLVVHYHTLLHKQVTDLPQDKIVNIAYEKKGFFSTLFDYGNIIIQQQSLNQPVVLKRLPDPSQVAEEIDTNVRTRQK